MNKELKLKIHNLIKITNAKLISSTSSYNGKFIKIIKERYLLPNNKIIERERIEKNNKKEAVIIIAITENNKYILVVQNRVNNIVSIEFPSGYIEENETIEESAIRELIEETGYISSDIEVIDNYYSQVGIDTSVVNIVIAYNCKKVSEQNLDDGEYINYLEFTFNEVRELINNNYIKSVGNKLAFYELYCRNNYRKKENVNKIKLLKIK